MIAIIDYGMGNIGSIRNMLVKTGLSKKDIILAHSKDDLKDAEKLILPGVGKFDTGITMLNESGMRERIDELVLLEHKPILGICLGMQMLGARSEEGNLRGLDYIPFSCKRFVMNDASLKVPHMGWDYVDIKDRDDPLVRGLSGQQRFYFVHSYYAVCEDRSDILMTCDYPDPFAAAVHRGNVYGTQFHPEKSHRFGMKLLKNFIEEL